MLSYFNGKEWNYKLRSKNKQQEYDDIGLLVNNNFIEPPDDVVEEIKEVLLRSTLQDIQINHQYFHKTYQMLNIVLILAIILL